MKCYFCDVAERKAWSGYYCKTCEEMQSIAKVYGMERMLEIMKTVCLRDEEQLEKKIKNVKKPVTRSSSNT
jgi:hypothetical protein